jgi:hypothetical protein
MTEPVTIGIGASKWVKESATKMITLHFPSSSGTHTLHDNTNTNYQVPVGKKFIILQVCSAGGSSWTGSSGASGGNYELWDSTVADTASGNIILINSNWISRTFSNYATYSAVSEGFASPIDTYIEVSAGQYITASVVSSTSVSVNITGVETDV